MARATNPAPDTPDTPDTPEQTTPELVAKQLAELVNADLNVTLAIMAGLLKAVRTTQAGRMPAAKPGADAARIELEKWYAAYKKARGTGTGDDPTAALIAAGAAAVTPEA